MSDVPELDTLLEEAETVRNNRRWSRGERLWRLTVGCAVLSFLLSLPLMFLFGDVGALIGTVLLCGSLLPTLVRGVFDFLVWAFQPPKPYDYTKRYQHK